MRCDDSRKGNLLAQTLSCNRSRAAIAGVDLHQQADYLAPHLIHRLHASHLKSRL
jgi:hypothetical protein